VRYSGSLLEGDHFNIITRFLTGGSVQWNINLSIGDYFAGRRSLGESLGRKTYMASKHGKRGLRLRRSSKFGDYMGSTTANGVRGDIWLAGSALTESIQGFRQFWLSKSCGNI